MKILIADSFPSSHVTQLEALGHRCTIDPGLNPESLTAAIGDHQALIVRSTKVSADAIDAGSDLKLIIRAGAGTNTIDKQHAAARSVVVCNVPGANAVAVAELVFGLLICIDRQIADNVAELRDGRWDKKRFSVARGLHGQSIGILGLGAIGFAVAERARVFGMEVCVVDRPGRDPATVNRISDLGIRVMDSRAALLGHCDIVSIHLPATGESRGMVNREFLDAMRDGATLINTSRGDLVDESALLDAIKSKGLRAGLDVYNNEPAESKCAFLCELASHPAVCGTHHIGASTDQAQSAVADGVIEIIRAFDKGDKLNCVND